MGRLASSLLDDPTSMIMEKDARTKVTNSITVWLAGPSRHDAEADSRVQVADAH